jgi:hypothetical protein
MVMTADALKSTGYQESTLVPKYLLAIFLAGRLASRLCKAAKPTR